MGQNFDDYPGFQQTPGMPILLQHSVIAHSELHILQRKKRQRSHTFCYRGTAVNHSTRTSSPGSSYENLKLKKKLNPLIKDQLKSIQVFFILWKQGPSADVS
jgi:hypothetical protein